MSQLLCYIETESKEIFILSTVFVVYLFRVSVRLAVSP